MDKYFVDSNTAKLPRQPDGVELYRGTEEEDERKIRYFSYKELLYFVGKTTYARESHPFNPIGSRFQLPWPGRKIFKTLMEAKREMIIQIFNKEKW